MATCPTCGQVLPPPRHTDRREELLGLLRGEARREVYLTDQPDRWCITYLSPKGNYQPFDSKTVHALVAACRLVQRYPNCNETFRLPLRDDR